MKAEPQKRSTAARGDIGGQVLTAGWQKHKRMEVSVYKDVSI